MQKMAYYHPFSAPPTLERQKVHTNSWLGSAKEMFMKPWRRRAEQRAKKGGKPVTDQASPSSLTDLDNRNNPFRGQQDFPNFSRLSPVGGRPQSRGKQMHANDYTDGALEGNVEVKIPEVIQPTRPPLSNIFPMCDSLKTSTLPSTSSSSNPDNNKRRHSTPAMPTSLILPFSGDRRTSASSDTSMDFRKERRERRASVTRDIPLLPKRGDAPTNLALHSPPPPQSHNKQGSPPISPYSEVSPNSELSPYSEASPDYTGPPKNTNSTGDYSDPRQISPNFRPPVAPGGLQSGYSYQPPHLQLQQLVEELEEDREGDGEEEGVKRIEEVPEALPAHKDVAMGDPNKIKQSEGGLGKLRVLKVIMSTKPTNEPQPPRPQPAEKAKDAKVKDANTDGNEIKGFDDFFMY